MKKSNIALVLVLALFTIAASNLRMAERKFVSRVFSIGSATSTHLNLGSEMATAGQTHYHEVCFRSMNGAATEHVYISSFSTTAPATSQTTSGWPIAGTEKECHDWNQGVPIHAWCDAAATCPTELRVLYVR